MGISSVLGFLALVGFIILLAGIGLAVSAASQNRPARGAASLAVVGLAIALIFGIASSGVVEVAPAQVAVIYQRIGGNPATNSLWERPLGPGVHVIIPLINEATTYTTQAMTLTMSRGSTQGADGVDARTSDGQQVVIDISVLYSIDAVRANTVHLLWQNRYSDEFVLPTVRSVVREIVAKYSVNDIYSDNPDVPSQLPQIQAEILAGLNQKFQDNGLVLRDFLLRETTFSEEFIRAVESKQVAQQQAEQAKQEAERQRTIAQGQADAAVTTAGGQAQSEIAIAKGNAEAIVLRAEAEAKALALISIELEGNPLLIQWRYINELADNVRMILVPSNSPYLFDLNSLTGGAVTDDGTTEPTQTPTPTETPQAGG